MKRSLRVVLTGVLVAGSIPWLLVDGGAEATLPEACGHMAVYIPGHVSTTIVVPTTDVSQTTCVSRPCGHGVDVVTSDPSHALDVLICVKGL